MYIEGKQSVSFMAMDLPTHLKNSKVSAFPKKFICYSSVRTTNEINFRLIDEATYSVHCTT